MPVITVENAGSLTKKQKAELISELSATCAKIIGKPESYIYVKISEIAPENFGIGGHPLG